MTEQKLMHIEHLFTTKMNTNNNYHPFDGNHADTTKQDLNRAFSAVIELNESSEASFTGRELDSDAHELAHRGEINLDREFPFVKKRIPRNELDEK